MAKKKDPDQIDKVIAELTSNTTAAELINDSSVLRELKKRLVEAALEAEMTDHLGYDKHSPDGHNSGNSRNGKSSKRILDGDGDYVIDVPRDRAGDFEPQFVRKRQVRLPGFDEKVLSLYATGLTTRQIGASLQEIYGVEVSPALISKVAGDGHVAGCRCPLAWSPPAHTPRCRLDTPRTSSNRRLRSHPPPDSA